VAVIEEEAATDGDWIGTGWFKSVLPKEAGKGLDEGDGHPDRGMNMADDRVDPPGGIEA
jgi:hypothetical protein